MAITAKHIEAPDLHRVRRALVSVFDKTGLIELAQNLQRHGVEIISTGGTYKALCQANIAVKDVSEITQFPEIMDGRVKTLHPNIHGAILGLQDDSQHRQQMLEHAISAIDLVVVNLYPFEETKASGADIDTIIENIDIGGPAMIRAGAKNHNYVSVITEVAQYGELMERLDANAGQLPFSYRRQCAARAYGLTAAYDSAIANWFCDILDEPTPPWRTIGGKLARVMRYGENPHQSGALYLSEDKRPGAAQAELIQGKALSYNNLNDTDAAFELVSEFDPKEGASVAIIKHANPCGVAQAKTLKEAYLQALGCDSVSAFGGIIAMNQELDAAAAEEIVKIFTEVIIAPAISPAAQEILAKKPNLRVLITAGLADPRQSAWQAKTIAGGLLVQSRDNGVVDDLDLRVVSQRKPSAREMADLKFAFKVAKHVKSNAIVYVKDATTVGIGAGQMSRVDSARIAAQKAGDRDEHSQECAPTQGSVVASDAFFPFADGLLHAIKAGARAVIQPGGSIRDDEVIKAADDHGVAMVFTGMRHFKH